jgi:hypothetical protein
VTEAAPSSIESAEAGRHCHVHVFNGSQLQALLHEQAREPYA